MVPLDNKKNIDTSKISYYFLRSALECGRRYLGSGGPTSRIEQSIELAGKRCGFDTQVFATPTGIYISIHSAQTKESHTEIARVKAGRINLEELTLIEKILNDFAEGKISLAVLNRFLRKKKSTENTYPFYIFYLAPFLIGFYSSFPRYESSTAAFFSGLLTLSVFLFTDVFQRKMKLNPIFTVFSSCFFALMGSFFLSQFFRLPPESFAIGTLIFLVPGLMLTTAISELSDQNLVSGSAKMMHGILILLAMGISYLLLLEVNVKYFNFNLNGSVLPVKAISENFWKQFISNAFLISAFAIYLNVPVKALLWSTLTGLLGWFVLQSVQDPSLYVLASFTASFFVGFTSLALGAAFKNPSQVYSVPGILSLLPGLLALSTFEAHGIAGSELSAPFRVALTGGAIVFGLITARIPALLFKDRLYFDQN